MIVWETQNILRQISLHFRDQEKKKKESKRSRRNKVNKRNIITQTGRNVQIIVDGGIRRGTDIVKALALGADAIMIGRPILWGLAVDGEDGILQKNKKGISLNKEKPLKKQKKREKSGKKKNNKNRQRNKIVEEQNRIY